MKRSKKLCGLIAAAVLVLLSTPLVLGQSTATLSGTVTDPSGAVVPNATVLVHSLATGVDRSTVSDGAGYYTAPSLQPGEYSVTVNAAGFARFVVERVTLEVDGHGTVNARLALSSTGETVQVEGTPPAIETQTITVGQVIDQKTVQEIPLNGRHFLDLTVLTPGGVTAPPSGNLTSPSRGLGANSFITAGNREDSVNFQINGVNLNDMVQNQITFQPSINTTSEFKINNSTYSAEYGRSSGSIVNVSTRSGTNAFHGEAFDYLRNNYFDARNYFNTKAVPQAALKRNNFGGALGGPIFRNRTFFFVSYEGLRQAQAITLNSGVFTNAQRTTIAATGSPSAKALLPLIPLANDSSGARFLGSTPGPVNIDQGTADAFHQFSPSDQIHGFYAFQADSRIEPTLQGNTISGFGDHRNSHRQILTLNETHIFNSNLVNEARLGFNRISIAFTPNAQLNPVNYGISSGITTALGLPQMTITDIGLNFGGPSTFPQGRTDTLGIFSDAATYLRGRHTIKFGGEYRRFLNANFAGDVGTLGFTTTATFIAGNATNFSITPSIVSSRIYANAIGAFVQDNYKIVPNLTLELGLRFEWNGTPTEGANRLVVFDAPTTSLIRTGTQGLGSVYKQNYNAEPRLGLAYDVFGTGKTVVRAGYGLMADQPTTNVITGLASNAPFAAPVSFNASSKTPSIPVSNLYGSAAASGLAISNVMQNFRNAYTQSYNFNIQQELPGRVALQAGYFGSVGRHLRARLNQNQPINGVRPYLAISSSSLIAQGRSTNANIAEASSVGSSNYNAMWLSARKSASHGLTLNTTYTYSKSLDVNSLGSQGGYVFQDSYNPGNNYGPSDFDVRHRISGSAIYELPFKGNRLVEGYQLSGIVQWQTGNPINVVNPVSTFNGLNGGTATVRPNVVAPIRIHKGRVGTNPNVTWITSTLCPTSGPVAGCAFVNTTNSFGSLSRNAITGPGFADVDFSLEKNTKITERVSMQLRADIFDIFNHPSFANPTAGAANASDTSTTFGQISATRFAVGDLGSSRQIQLAGKIIF
ncbi:TonB-dependent receptor [Edaphobacter bradus]|uniref:TonB-dependent receptor n=1 Tax=Edaphobacter bradus TaxID=2259016 RepID=UPI0021E0FC0D|nr:carboxypeptidase regulatory-like domain-containing protein [Edaphobacter bradus]